MKKNIIKFAAMALMLMSGTNANAHLDREKTIEQAEKSLSKFGGETLARFRDMKRLFEPNL